MARQPVGERELRLLQELVQRGPGTVGELQARFGEPLGLARQTVLTMMERLRRKGYLTRRREDGVYRYEPKGGDVVSGAVGRFVEKALGGSLSPFVAYLADRETISDGEFHELEELLDRLRTRRKER